METGYDQLLKVMFVDDEEKTRKLLRVFVDWQSIGYEPVEDAASANQAMELIEEEHPDVVITDIEMPISTAWNLPDAGGGVSADRGHRSDGP